MRYTTIAANAGDYFNERIAQINQGLKKSIPERLNKISNLYDSSIEGKFNVRMYKRNDKGLSKIVVIHWTCHFVEPTRNINDVVLKANSSYSEVGAAKIISFEFYFNQRFELPKILDAFNHADYLINHEIKHGLDSFDGILKDNHKRIPEEEIFTRFNEYLNLPAERAAYLITMIEELKNIRQTDPAITFQDALTRSRYWNKGLKQAYQSDRKFYNKFVSKLSNFWHGTK